MTTRSTPTETSSLIWIRAGARAALALAVSASVAANVLHAQPNPVGRAIAAWSPLALLLAVELISRVPVHRPVMSLVRMTATAAIAGIAAWVSYWHMVSVAIRYGETSSSAHLLPLSVDGLVVVASVSLVEISSRLRDRPTDLDAPHEEDVPTGLADTDDRAGVPARPSEPVSASPVDEMDGGPPTDDPEAIRAPKQKTRPQTATTNPIPSKPIPSKRGGSQGRTSTPVLVRSLAAAHPEWTTAQIAAKAGCSPRTARRHLTGDRGSTGPEAAPAQSSHDADREAGQAA